MKEPDAQRAKDAEKSKEDASAPLLTPSPCYHATGCGPSTPSGRTPERKGRLVTLLCIIALLLLARPAMRDWGRWRHDAHRLFNGGMDKNPYADDVDGCVKYASWSVEHEHPSRVHPNGFMSSARASFALPASSELLYLISRGSPALVRGYVEVSASEDVMQDVVEVDVSASFNDKHMFRHTKVCLLRRGGDENGVGIFAPTLFHYQESEQQVLYDIRVRIPAQNGTYTSLKHLMTNLPVFDHRISDLGDDVHFNSFTIRTSNAEVDVTGVSASRISIITSNKPIQGRFRSSSSITLHTSNAFINADVELAHDGVAAPTRLEMMTSNGRIDAGVSAVSTARDGRGGVFGTVAATSNAPTHLAYSVAPIDSVLLLDGRTTNGPLVAALPSTYEGSFSLANSASFTPEVQADPDPEDPEHLGRHREVQMHRVNGGSVEGHVSWRTPTRHSRSGWARLTTTNAPLTLVL